MYDLDKIKEIPIEDVCSMLGVELEKKSGQNIWGSIRNERTGSFSINPTKNIWRDWGMNEGGTPIDLVMKMENVDNGKAIQILGERFNIEKEFSDNSHFNILPSKKQFAEIGIVSDRTLSNFDLDLEKQTIEKLQELEAKYSINISDFSKSNPQFYHKIIDKKALPIIIKERNSLIDTLKKYQSQTKPLDREVYKTMIVDLEESLNSKIDIYNKSRLDGVNKNNLRINAINRLPDEHYTLEAKIPSKEISKNYLDSASEIGISFDNQGTEYPKEIPNEDIKDIEKVTEWNNLLSENDSILMKDNISYYLAHKSSKTENSYQMSVYQDRQLTELSTDIQFSNRYALAKSLSQSNKNYEILDKYNLAPIDNLKQRQDMLDVELKELEQKINSLDNRINSYTTDLTQNKGKYHIYSISDQNEVLITSTNTKKEANGLARNLYLNSSQSTEIKDLKKEINSLQEKITEERKLYDITLTEYKGTLEYTNPYSSKNINIPPTQNELMNESNDPSKIKSIFISKAEGLSPLPEATVTSFSEANEILVKWAKDMPEVNLGYDKTDFVVEFENGFKYSGTFDLKSENRNHTSVPLLQNQMIQTIKTEYALYPIDDISLPDHFKNYYANNNFVNSTKENFNIGMDHLKSLDWENADIGNIRKDFDITNNEVDEETYKYYLTQRPPSIGTHPQGASAVVSFDNKEMFEGVNCWGYVEYKKPLTHTQIADYELSEKKSYIYEIKGKNLNLETENLNEIEFFTTNKNLTLEDGSKIRNGTSFRIEGGDDTGYDVHFEANSKNKYTNDTAEYVFTKSEILDFATPDIEMSNTVVTDKEFNKAMEEMKVTDYIEREINDIMEEIKQVPLIDMKIDKDVDVTEIMDNLKNGVGNIFNNQNFVEYLNFQSQFHNYSPSNNMLIAIQNPQATNVASFTKWKSMGRTVNRGEKGIMILAPNKITNGSKEIFERLDKYGKTNVNKYTFVKSKDKYLIGINGKPLKTGLSKNELDQFIKINKLTQSSMKGFKKTYVFDVSQTSGQPIPQFKLDKLNDNNLIDENGFYKNPLIKVNMSEGSIFEKGQVLTFKQANEIFERKEKEILSLKDHAAKEGKYYPYMKQRIDVILKPNNPVNGIAKDIRIDIGDGNYNNLLEALKGEMSGYPQIFPTLKETLNSNDKNTETILSIKNQLENITNSKGITLEYSTDTKGANGYFSPLENKICVNSEMSLSQETKTLLHEYVHSQLHSDGAEAKDNLATRQTAEIEAEGTTYVVAKHFGFDTSDYSFDYVSTWARGQEVNQLTNTLKNIKTTSEKIINEIKAPLELELYNNKTNIEEILKSANIKPNDTLVNNIIDINKETGKINTVSDLSTAEKFKSYDNKDLSTKISDTNKEISNNIVKIEIKEISIER